MMKCKLNLAQLWVFLLLFVFVNNAIAADPGRITGKVTDKKTGEALIGVTVVVQGTTKGAVTDVEGRYTIAVEPGTYTLDFKYMGYQTKSISEVAVKAAAPTSLDIIMDEPQSKALQEVVIRGSYKQETINALYAAQKSSAVVSDGISTEAIKKSPDKNTSEVLKRVSGTSIQDNKFIVVRGLSERYNSTLMNNATLPSTEPDKKAFSFDIIPSNLIDNVVIYKTASPDLPGDFAGGAVKVNTKDFPSEKMLSISLGYGYNTQTTFKKFQSGPRGSWDWLGFDDGGRALPDAYKNAKENYISRPVSEQQQITLQFPNSYQINSRGRSLPNQNYQVTFGNTLHAKNSNKFGYIASLSYRQSKEVNFRDRDDYNGAKFQLYSFDDGLYTNNSTVGAMLNFSYSFKKSKLALKNFFNNNFSDQYVDRVGGYYEGNTVLVKSMSLETTQNGLANSVLEGSHSFGERNMLLEWNLSYGYSYRNQPDHRILQQQLPEGGTNYQIFLSNYNSPSIQNAGRVYSDLGENIYGGNLGFTVPFKLFDQPQKVKIGGTKTYRKRDFSIDALGYSSGSAGPVVIDMDDKVNTPSTIFSPSSIRDRNIILSYIPTNSYDYEGTADLNAGYLMLDNKFSDKFRLLWGARIENFQQKLTPTRNPAGQQKYDNTDVLPSANLTYSATERTNVRLSYSQTVNRPEFREIAAYRYYDFTTNYIIEGNPALRRSKADNADLRVEFFPSAGEIISGSVFYKRFKNPIEQANYGNAVFGYINAGEATDYGAEIEVRKKLDFFSPAWLQHMTVYTNAAWISSDVKLGADSRNRPLQGQSPYLINAGLQYASDDNDFSVNVLYNRVGQRLAFVGQNIGVDIYEKPRDLVDFQISKKVFKKAGEIKLNVSDILKQPIALYYNFDSGTAYNKSNDKIIQSVKPGTTISLGFTYNLSFNKK